MDAPAEVLSTLAHGRVRKPSLSCSGFFDTIPTESDLKCIGAAFPSMTDLVILPSRRGRGGLPPASSTLSSVSHAYGGQLVRLEFVAPFAVDDNPPSLHSATPFHCLTELRFKSLSINAGSMEPFRKQLAAVCPTVRTLEVEEFDLAHMVNFTYTNGTVGRLKRRSRRFSASEKEGLVASFFDYQAGAETRRMEADAIQEG